MMLMVLQVLGRILISITSMTGRNSRDPPRQWKINIASDIEQPGPDRSIYDSPELTWEDIAVKAVINPGGFEGNMIPLDEVHVVAVGGVRNTSSLRFEWISVEVLVSSSGVGG